MNSNHTWDLLLTNNIDDNFPSQGRGVLNVLMSHFQSKEKQNSCDLSVAEGGLLLPTRANVLLPLVPSLQWQGLLNLI